MRVSWKKMYTKDPHIALYFWHLWSPPYLVKGLFEMQIRKVWALGGCVFVSGQLTNKKSVLRWLNRLCMFFHVGKSRLQFKPTEIFYAEYNRHTFADSTYPPISADKLRKNYRKFVPLLAVQHGQELRCAYHRSWIGAVCRYARDWKV